jgi:hypothetical protein
MEVPMKTRPGHANGLPWVVSGLIACVIALGTTAAQEYFGLPLSRPGQATVSIDRGRGVAYIIDLEVVS